MKLPSVFRRTPFRLTLLFLALYLGCNALFHALYRRFHLPGFEET